MDDLTLFNIMAEDLVIYATYLKDKQIAVTVTNEEDIVVFHEDSHVFAWESLVYFAKQVIILDKTIQLALNEH